MKKALVCLLFLTACQSDAQKCESLVREFCALKLPLEVPPSIIKALGTKNLIDGCVVNVQEQRKALNFTDSECIEAVGKLVKDLKK